VWTAISGSSLRRRLRETKRQALWVEAQGEDLEGAQLSVPRILLQDLPSFPLRSELTGSEISKSSMCAFVIHAARGTSSRAEPDPSIRGKAVMNAVQLLHQRCIFTHSKNGRVGREADDYDERFDISNIK
jgi:hypothetical protein